MAKLKVFITRKIPDAGINLLKRKFIVKIYPKDNAIPRKELEKGVKWCDALLSLLTEKIDSKLMDLNKNLKIISNYAVGFDNVDIKAANERRIPVTNTPDVLTHAVSEHTIALLMSITRRIPESDNFTREGKYKAWSPMLFLGSGLRDKTLGVVGLGRIGSNVARIAIKGFGMKVIYNKKHRDKGFEKKYNAKFVSLSSLMKKSDFISLHTPLNKSTRHLIGKKQLGMMKKTAYLINTSRGPIIDEKALVKVLRKKKIKGAALDVFEKEPKLSPGMSKLNNIVLTPHIASGTIEARSAMAVLAANGIIDASKGKIPANIVNKEILGSKENKIIKLLF